MPIKVINPEKQEAVEKDGSKVFFRYPSKTAILDCFSGVLGEEFDLRHLEMDKLLPQQIIGLVESVSGLCITGWENVEDQDGNLLEFRKELVEFIDYGVKMEVFNRVLDFLTVQVGGTVQAPTAVKTPKTRRSKTIRKGSSTEGKT